MTAFKIQSRDFPDGPVVKNLPGNAGDIDSIPSQGLKIPKGGEQLSQQATVKDTAWHNEGPEGLN